MYPNKIFGKRGLSRIGTKKLLLRADVTLPGEEALHP